MMPDVKNIENTQKSKRQWGAIVATSVRDARKVVITVASLVFIVGVLALLGNIVHTDYGKTILGIAMGFVLLSILLAYRNIIKPAQILTPIVAFLILTFFLVDGDGVHDATITAYSAVVILAGLLLGQQGVIIFGALTTVSLVGLAYGEYLNVGVLQTKYSGLFDLIDVNTLWFLHLATSTIIYFLVRRFSRIANEVQERNLQFARANEELTKLRDILQERVEQRTGILEQQNAALQTASYIASEILSSEDVTQLLRTTVDLIAKEFKYDHVGIFLLNEKKDQAVLQAASSETGKQMIANHHELAIDETSVVGIVAKEESPRIALNQGMDQTLFKDPWFEGVQSEFALPLISQEEVLGVLDIQSKEEEAFTQGNIAIFQSLANQIALTIQNTRLIEESQINLAQLELIVAEQSTSVWSKHLQNRTYGFVYTPLGVKPLRTARLDKEDRPGVEKADIPITLRGRKIGAISLQRLSRHWTKKEKTLLEDVAAQIGLAVENARLLHETREQAHQEQLVSDVSSRLRETLDMDTVLKTAVEEMRRTFNLKEVEVRLAPANEPEEPES